MRSRFRRVIVMVGIALAFQFSSALPAAAAECVTPSGIDGECTCSLAGFCHTVFGDFACSLAGAGWWCSF